MTKHCLNTHFYVQGVPVETGTGVVDGGTFDGRSVVTYDDFAAARKSFRRALSPEALARFDRLTKAEQLDDLGVVLSSMLHDGDTVLVCHLGASLRLVVDTAAMTGRAGRSAFDPAAYVRSRDPLARLEEPARRQARAEYAALALAHLNADLGESRDYARRVVSAFARDATPRQVAAALVNGPLAELLVHDGYVPGVLDRTPHAPVSTVGSLVNFIASWDSDAFSDYARAVAARPIVSLGDALQFACVAAIGSPEHGTDRYITQLQTAGAVLATSDARTLGPSQDWVRLELAEQRALGHDALAPESSATGPVTAAPSPLWISPRSIDLFATRPLETRHAVAARERRVAIERAVEVIAQDEDARAAFTAELAARPLGSCDDALVFATFASTQGVLDPADQRAVTQYERALQLLGVAPTVETARAALFVRERLYEATGDAIFAAPADDDLRRPRAHLRDRAPGRRGVSRARRD